MRAALFDLDETLLDRTKSLHDFVTWQATGMLRASLHDTDQFVKRFIALDQHGMVWKDEVYTKLVEEFDITDWTAEDLLASYLLTFCAFCKPRNGALCAIESFRNKGYKVGLVTNGKTPFQERNFRALGFTELFDCVIVSEAEGIRKPDKAIFQLACSRLNADISSSWFIGDNPVSDIQGAKNAGMSTIYVPIDANHHPCKFADAVFSDLSEIADYDGL